MIFTIGPASRKVGYSRETLKLLELKGVVRPARDAGNRRVYTEADLKAVEDYRSRQARHANG